MTLPSLAPTVLLITRNKYGMGAQFFPSEAAALADVVRELQAYGLPEDVGADTAAISNWIGEEDIDYEFDLQTVTLPAYRVVAADPSGAVVADTLVYGDHGAAAEVVGAHWNAYGFGHQGRAVYLYRAGTAGPIQRLSHDDAADALVTDPLTRPLLRAVESAVESIQALTDARQAGTSMVEASTILEDWAAAASEFLPDVPGSAEPFDAPELREENGDDAVMLEYIGEGADGDYDQTDPGDEPLMRVSVERKGADGAWEYVEDSSYCTRISARASEAAKRLALLYILNGLPSGSVKRYMERMSWIEVTPQDGDSPDFSNIPA
ncbi:hypothetical protein KIKIMORA_04840 [Brevundimonas phage vB_BpoS-Kikimora]|uniref:Uncharacterized protein n=1 Tax=Brevundimonas phage vB_BpoS-Kikimora TaxID=2948601 RepID=A0A9E7MT51_9CAUD|nr:hypothetical protein KIKIMORA_04840 [Brevundimonas phage vB_BpoS-Kikimora]